MKIHAYFILHRNKIEAQIVKNGLTLPVVKACHTWPDRPYVHRLHTNISPGDEITTCSSAENVHLTGMFLQRTNIT